MSKMIQVRNVPNRLHDELVRRAKARSLTLTAYVEQVLEREIARPPREEIFDRIARRDPIVLDRSSAEIIHSQREERERHLRSLLTRRRSASTS